VPYVYNVQDIYPDVAIRLGVLTNPRVIAFFRWMERFV
jgi:colanic acid biosynthesis glycosyl transferase WcaI